MRGVEINSSRECDAEEFAALAVAAVATMVEISVTQSKHCGSRHGRAKNGDLVRKHAERKLDPFNRFIIPPVEVLATE